MKKEVIVAIIGAVGVVLAALIGYLSALAPVREEIRATQTAESNFNSTKLPESTEISISPQLLLVGVRCGYSYTVEAGRPIVLKYGAWGASNIELAYQNAEHLDVKLLVDGREVAGRQQPPMSSEDIDYSQCGNLEDGSYWIMHVANLEPFSQGEHVIEIEYIFDDQISDGFDSDVDGTPDVYGPGGWGYQTHTIIAEPPP
jgi:hypothetical protein